MWIINLNVRAKPIKLLKKIKHDFKDTIHKRKKEKLDFKDTIHKRKKEKLDFSTMLSARQVVEQLESSYILNGNIEI